MKIDSILVVCVGNICRSPLGERMLQSELDALGAQISVSSAGIHALVDHPADEDASAVAAEHGVSLDGHKARQFTEKLGRAHDLILVMEAGHKAEVVKLAPALSGKTFLFDQWSGNKGIADPYRHSREFHEAVFAQVRDGAKGWVGKLVRPARK
ncbi:low molecular weight protein-tyrosine-phosphatase [Pararhodobacter oceanensis]|uniref:protein-tyrosine-phosphatase n=1 Tax=Pararhodobacter oceanensis TaxID=2172121 RepID=A0A2T8HRV3_9RHOB|nr:low molecular weight protein-tyrosine-phosphatase [Pararhodobacter oceanensis]PVH28123.1 phosphotyrosine protein phosphatase [Pararhodobacter oceanensis]